MTPARARSDARTRLGAALERAVDGVAQRAAGLPGGAAFLGATLAAIAVLGGVAVLVGTWAVLVGVLHS